MLNSRILIIEIMPKQTKTLFRHGDKNTSKKQ